MNDDVLDKATNQPVSLNNEATPDAAIFLVLIPLPLSVPPLAQAPSHEGGYLLQPNNDDEYSKEEEALTKKMKTRRKSCTQYLTGS